MSLITDYLSARGILPQTALDHGFEFDTSPSKALITQRLKGDLRLNGQPVSSIAKEILWMPVKGPQEWWMPEQERGRYQWIELPDSVGGGRVWGRFMGTVSRFVDIPSGAIPGDLWNVEDGGGSTWILCQPPGYSHLV